MTENICCVCGREYELKNGGWYCPRCMAKRFSADERLTVRVTDEPTETVEESVTEAKPTDKDKGEPVKIIEDIFVENELRIAEINLKAGAFDVAAGYYARILERGENATALRGLIYVLLGTKGEDGHAAALNINKLKDLDPVSRLIAIDEENVLDVAWLIGVVGKSLEMRVDPEGMSTTDIKSTKEISDDTVERSTTPGGTARSACALAVRLMNLVDEKKHYLLADSLFKVAHNAKLLGCYDEAHTIFERLCTLCESSWELRIAELEARKKAKNTDELLLKKGDIGTDSAFLRAMELVPSSNNVSLAFLARLSVEQDHAAKRKKEERTAAAKIKKNERSARAKKKREDNAAIAKKRIGKIAAVAKKCFIDLWPIMPCALLFLLSLLIPSIGMQLLGCAAGLFPISIFLYFRFTLHKTKKLVMKLSTLLYIGCVVLLTALLMLCIGSCLGAMLASLLCTLGLFSIRTFFKDCITRSRAFDFLWSVQISAGMALFGVSLGSCIGFDSAMGGLFAGIAISFGVIFNTVYCIVRLKDNADSWIFVALELFYLLGAIALFVLCFISRALAFMAMPSVVTLFVSFILFASFADRMSSYGYGYPGDKWKSSNILTSVATSVFVILVLCWSFGVWRASPIKTDKEGYRVNMTYSEEVIVIPEGVTHLERVRAPRAEKIVLPSTLVHIGDGCFRGCGAVEIDIPETVTYIGDKAFKKCKSLAEVDLPDSLTYLGKSAFKKCESIVSIEIPAGITELKDYTFQYCLGLKEVMFNEGLETIGLSCFNNCASLTDVYLPDSLKNMFYCFNYCSNLRSISLGKGLIRLNDRLFDYSNIPLLKVTFRGTEEEWNGITKHKKWYKNAKEIELTFTEQ